MIYLIRLGFVLLAICLMVGGASVAELARRQTLGERALLPLIGVVLGAAAFGVIVYTTIYLEAHA